MCADGVFLLLILRRGARCGERSFGREGKGRRNDGRDERFGGRWPAVAGIRDFREALRDDGVGGGSTRDFGRGLGRACTVHGD